MFIKPAPGLMIRDPELFDLLPEEGREVSDDQYYWHCRLRDGDVVLAEKPSTPALAAPVRNKGSDQS